jgi:hypothetical protein
VRVFDAEELCLLNISIRLLFIEEHIESLIADGAFAHFYFAYGIIVDVVNTHLVLNVISAL